MPVSIIASVSVIVGFLLLALGFYIVWKKRGGVSLSDIIELTVYSFISGASVGAFINATFVKI